MTRIKDIAVTTTEAASDDYVAIDGATNGSRRILVTDIGGGAGSPALRGSSFTNGTQNLTLPLPAGSVAGDRAFILGAGGNYLRFITGWDSIEQEIGNGWSFNFLTKVLDAADISNGSIAVSFSGSFSEHAVILVFEGDVAEIEWIDFRQSDSGRLAAYFTGYRYNTPKIPSTSKVYMGLTARVNQTNTCADATLLHDSKRTNGSLTFYELSADANGFGATPVIPASGSYDAFMIRFAVTA